ncbi:MAG: GAF domain-containing protein [Candidatus Rokubacteria bacterium]|nr:GAF domain-containing protein [Candidatus Rokubacteria bacterium]
MSLHSLLPLLAFLLNVSLAGITVLRNPGSRLNRLFTYFVSGMAVWNFGVFMLRRSPDEPTAVLWEVVIHAGVVVLPAFYYHFVLIFLESTTRHRPALTLAYLLAIFFSVVNLSGSSIFMKGVKWTYWGWAPATGLLYTPFFLYFNFFMIYGLVHLVRTYKDVDSSFRRNRATLIVLGTLVSLAGGFIDFARFILARFVPAADLLYPMGIPANMVFALMLGTSIVRYRLFDVNVAVKKSAIYLLLWGVLTSILVLAEQYADWEQVNPLWIILPLGFLMTLLVSPLGHRLEDQIERLMFSRRRGCYETLLDLSKRMSTILDFGRLMETLVHGLVRGVPLTHCVLMIYDAAQSAFIVYREETNIGEGAGVSSIPVDSPVVQWLNQTGRLLVKEEVKLNPVIAEYFETAEGELEEIKASLIVPLKIENKLTGILLVGEKLSGDIFDAQELEVLSVLANQVAISLENARLYEELASSNAQLMQASRLKSQFLASMSHELRTPLNSIIGFSKVLLNRLDGDLTERQEVYIRSVHNSGTHLLQLINGILDFSRIEAGKLEMMPEDLDLHDLIDECIESSLPMARGKQLKIEKDVPLETPRLTADRTKVKQILLNLLSNAIKFTQQGRVVIGVVAEPEAVRISVADTGVGIRDEDLARLFEPFQQLDNPVARGAGGTGLGLAISKKFVELHGGRIWAESRENQGSTFHFTLPLNLT